MKHFYGYRRRTKDIPEGMDRVWMDDETTGRQERNDMMLMIQGVEEKDEVHVLAHGDLGRGAEAKYIREVIEADGHTVKVAEGEGKSDGRGRPAQFKPDDAQDKKIKRLYHSYNAMHYVLDRVEEIMGQRFQAHHLKRRYGNRWQK